LPRDVVRYTVKNGLEGVMSPDTHLMYDEYGREGRVGIRDVEGDGFTMERPKNGMIRVVDKYEFLNIWTVTDEV